MPYKPSTVIRLGASGASDHLDAAKRSLIRGIEEAAAQVNAGSNRAQTAYENLNYALHRVNAAITAVALEVEYPD